LTTFNVDQWTYMKLAMLTIIISACKSKELIRIRTCS